MEKLIISSDSHVFEPGDLWSKTLGSRFPNDVPQQVSSFEGREGLFFYVGRPGEAAKMDELVSANSVDRRLEDLAKAGSDPVYRLELMAKDNIAAEVLYPTWGLWIPRMPNGAARNACAEVYNDWIQEYCSQDRKKLLANAMIPIIDVEWATKELARTMKRGARGILIGTSPVRNLIRTAKTFQLPSTMQTGRDVGMVTMNDSLLELVKSKKVEPLEAYMKAVQKQELKAALQKLGIQINVAEDKD